VLDLGDPAADDEALAGAKAANLARCVAAGLRIVTGFVLTTEGARRGPGEPDVAAALRSRWESAGGARTTFVVRSSSTVEDAGESSMAGQFTTVLDVTGWEALLSATEEVIASASGVAGPAGEARPIAVLVQRQLDPAMAGVLFGIDPVTGDGGRLAVDVVGGRPDALVSGEVTAAHYVLTRRGRIVGSSRIDAAPPLSPRLARRLADVALRSLSHFHRPQDMEWAVDANGTLWVLQSRPVTAVTQVPDGAVLGPGPVAETFPDPLSELEADLWVGPLRDGLARALRITGAASDAELEASPVCTTVGGWAAVDLELLGLTRGERSFWRRLSPSYMVRHLARSWRVGRTRVALPSLGGALLALVDAHLSAVPSPHEMATVALVDLVDRALPELATVHAAEVLCGMLLRAEHTPPTGSVALAVLARARAEGVADDEILASRPVVLALCAPSTAHAPVLAAEVPPPPPGVPPAGVDDLGLRDGLRLRTRWLQELTGRAALELAGRLVADGHLGSVEAARHLRWEEMRAVAHGSPPPADLAERAARAPGPPLPAAFRVGRGCRVLAEDRAGARAGAGAGAGGGPAGQPAGGGRAAGVVAHRPVPGGAIPGGDAGGDVGGGTGGRTDGTVLVVEHLVPELAPLLPALAGLVAETGSALSHLAILAREMQVPTVVGVADARRRFPPGTRVMLDGLTGEVEVLHVAGADP
jgi:pyruvate,water dikinase